MKGMIARKTPLKRSLKPIKRSPIKRKKSPAKAKRKKTTRADLLRLYEVPITARLRYESNLYKGIYWWWFARYVRLRDATLYGVCISCGKPKTFDELQAGHFAPAGQCGFDLVFDERNVNGECGYCNAYDESHLWGYERNLDIRYGRGTAEGLRTRYDKRHMGITTKEWGVPEYIQQIGRIMALFKDMSYPHPVDN